MKLRKCAMNNRQWMLMRWLRTTYMRTSSEYLFCVNKLYVENSEIKNTYLDMKNHHRLIPFKIKANRTLMINHQSIQRLRWMNVVLSHLRAFGHDNILYNFCIAGLDCGIRYSTCTNEFIFAYDIRYIRRWLCARWKNTRKRMAVIWTKHIDFFSSLRMNESM